MASSSTVNEEECTNVNVDIEHIWANSIKKKLNASKDLQMSGNEFTICQVPSHVRRGKEMYYEPALVSIGPYHHGRKELQAMEGRKLQFLNDFLQRNSNKELDVYVRSLREVEGRARKCYYNHINLESEQFVEMMLIDGCFIIEYFLKRRFKTSKNKIQVISWFDDGIVTDLYLLENQIPFFIIKILFDLVRNGDDERQNERLTNDMEIAEIIGSFGPGNSLSPTMGELRIIPNDDYINHLLHLYYYSFVSQLQHTAIDNKSSSSSFLSKLKLRLLSLLEPISPSSENLSPVQSTLTIPCATKLVEYGVKLKKRDGKTLTDIAYEDGILEIPPIIIDDLRKSWIFNMLAFEQTDAYAELKLSTYIQFMDFLIDTHKDVEILQERGIITSYVKTSEELAFLFNQFNDFVFVPPKEHDLIPVYQEITKFIDSKWHRYRAKLMRDYFSNPWSILSLIAAVILLALTFVQAFFAVYK